MVHMVQSKIQFDRPILTKCEYMENNYKQQISSDIRLNIESKYKKDDNKNVAIVVVSVEIGERNVDSPFYINAEYSANFRWDKDIVNPDVFLKVNAPALLYSYVRPMISVIMSNTKFGKLDLPFMDFSQMINETNKHEN